MAWIFLLVGGVLEIGFALCLKASDGFSKPLPTAGFIAFAALSFACVNLALRDLPIGTAYAVWTGIGAVGTVLYGMVFLAEPRDLARIFCLVLIIGGIGGLKLLSPH